MAVKKMSVEEFVSSTTFFERNGEFVDEGCVTYPEKKDILKFEHEGKIYVTFNMGDIDVTNDHLVE